MYNNKVFICGVDTSSLPVMKETEKIELLKKARAVKGVKKIYQGNAKLFNFKCFWTFLCNGQGKLLRAHKTGLKWDILNTNFR